MSAIFGLLRLDGVGASPRELERMANMLRPRGPDGRKSMIAGPAALGHCLMRVTQEDLFEAQPLQDAAAKLVLVADLRLDNREALAEALHLDADALAAMPDSALLLRTYEKWGADCAEHLLGDFTFAIWDGARRQLVLGRDHMGQRPLYYHHGADFFAFASEIKALWAVADVPRALNEAEIARLIARRGPRSRQPGATFHDGIFGLLGGALLLVGADGAVEQRRYWEPRADPAHEGRDEAYYVARYRAVLEEAVACRLRRLTRPAALMFSAGFDSAAIAGLAQPMLAAQKRRLLGLTQVVSPAHVGSEGDMRPWVEACRRVMPQLDVRYLLPGRRSPFDALEKHFAHYDGPAPVRHNAMQQFFSEAAAAGARVIMDGIGGDYTLNPRGHGAFARLLRQGRFGRLLLEMRCRHRVTGVPLWRILRSDVLAPLVPVRWRRRTEPSGFAEAIGATQTLPLTAMRARIVAAARAVPLLAGAGVAVPAAQAGLVLTRPFHDKRVVELGLAVPEDLYVGQGLTRYLARLALADVYPPEFAARGGDNDPATPEFSAMFEAAAPMARAEAERMAQNPALARLADFAALRGFLARAPNTPDRSGEHAALHTLLIARYVEWFRRDNRS
jgi:asparagine synthase (glutamine-hydrolysing)